MQYANDVQVILDDSYPNGLRFEGSDGWVFCARGAAQVTGSDPTVSASEPRALDASDPSILSAPFSATDVRWAPSDNHYRNWLEAIVSRNDPIAPVDQAEKSLQTCAAAWISMKLDRPVTWDAAREEFPGDVAANAMRSRAPRLSRYDVRGLLRRAGVAAGSGLP